MDIRQQYKEAYRLIRQSISNLVYANVILATSSIPTRIYDVALSHYESSRNDKLINIQSSIFRCFLQINDLKTRIDQLSEEQNKPHASAYANLVMGQFWKQYKPLKMNDHSQAELLKHLNYFYLRPMNATFIDLGSIVLNLSEDEQGFSQISGYSLFGVGDHSLVIIDQLPNQYTVHVFVDQFVFGKTFEDKDKAINLASALLTGEINYLQAAGVNGRM